LAGKKPILLTKRGKKEIKEAAKKLKSKKIDLVFSSPFNRTRETAEIISKELGIKVIYDERLKEINFGIFQSGPKEKYLKFFSDVKERFFKRPPKGEDWNDVKGRTEDFLNEIEKKYKNKNILIIGHGDPLWILEGIIKKMNNKNLLEKKFKGLFLKTGEFKKI
jgi:broad specificity phosphatase PhoE